MNRFLIFSLIILLQSITLNTMQEPSNQETNQAECSYDSNNNSSECKIEENNDNSKPLTIRKAKALNMLKLLLNQDEERPQSSNIARELVAFKTPTKDK